MRYKLQTRKWFPSFPMIAIIGWNKMRKKTKNKRQKTLDVAKEMGKANNKKR